MRIWTEMNNHDQYSVLFKKDKGKIYIDYIFQTRHTGADSSVPMNRRFEQEKFER